MAAEGRQAVDASCILRAAAGSREEFKSKDVAGGQVGPKSAFEVASKGASSSMFTSVTVYSVTVEPGEADKDLAICCDGVPNISRESQTGPVVFLPKKLLAEGGTIYPGAKFMIRSTGSLPKFTLRNDDGNGVHSGAITMLVKLRVE